MKIHKYILPLLSLSLLSPITGCSERVLDWRNASISGEKIFEKDQNSPFSGKITNIPFEYTPLHNYKMFSQLFTRYTEDTHDYGYAPISSFGWSKKYYCDTFVKDGFLTGNIKCQNGSLTIETNFSDISNKGEGEIKFRDESNNLPSAIAHFVGNDLNGILEITSPNGYKIVSETTFKESAVGPFTFWFFDSKQVKSKGVIDKDRYIGEYKKWFSNGDPSEEIYFDDNGLANGPLKIWDKDTHKLVAVANLKDNKLDGRRTTWDSNGNLLTDRLYEEGRYAYDIRPRNISIDECTTEWADAYRKEIQDDEKPIFYDQIKEWEDICAEKKYAPIE